MREEANGFLPHLFKKTSHRVRAAHGAKKFRSVFGGGVYVVKNTLRGAERNPLVKKAAPF